MSAAQGAPMRARRRTRSATRPTAGFTLVELMVSIMILVVGLLGMAGTSAVITRQMGGGMQMALAATVAQARFELLRSGTCTALSGGTAVTHGITEVWTATALSRAVQVTDTVKFTTTRGQRAHAYRTLIPCPALP